VKEDCGQTPIAGNAVSEEDRTRSAEGQVYQIKIKGHIDQSWSEWLGGLTITHEAGGTTVLTGPIIDQPALYGLLIRLRDLGLSLVSVNAPGLGRVGSVGPDQGR
jgi:hypothetical protein